MLCYSGTNFNLRHLRNKTMDGLVLHCGAHKATWQDVINSRAREPKSDTYVPIEHGEFVNTVIEALDHHGYEIKSEAHALMKQGQ